MTLFAFSVYDKCVGAFLPPFYVRSEGEAVRSFYEACNDPKVPFGKNAGDYSLFRLGSWNDSNGLFSCGEPTRVISALEVQSGSQEGVSVSPN